MANRRIKLSEMDILSKVKLPLMPGDIVTDRPLFPNSKKAEHLKILSIWDLEIPYQDQDRPPHLETWANVEIVRSPLPAAIGIKMSDPISKFGRVEKRSIADYIRDREVS